MIRVLIADDSPTARQMLATILGDDSDVEVIGTARDGHEVVKLARRLHPDVITMDLHMPGLNGFEATKQVMIHAPTPIVIVSASSMVQDSQNAMRAMRAGALTVAMKPPGPGDPSFARLARELVENVKAMAEVKVVRHHRIEQPSKPRQSGTPTGRTKARPSKPPQVIAIAASTGGPPAILGILSKLPESFPVPILVVQHITPGFTAGLVSWLDDAIPLTVKVAQASERAVAGTVYVAPEDRHLGVSRGGLLEISGKPAIRGFRPSASYLFQSVARSCGANSLAVILTGMGSDGVDGLSAIRDVGGRVIAQDEASCVVFGMPAAAIAAEAVDIVLPLAEIPDRLITDVHLRK